MPSSSSPFGPDTLTAAAYLMSDRNDAGYLAWRAEHPDAFAAGTWTRPVSARRPTPPEGSKSRLTSIDPAATVSTQDLVAGSDLSTQEFLEMTSAARTGVRATRASESDRPHTESDEYNR